MKPRLLDLFCGAGGCSVGYHRAGFEVVVGVDNKPHPDYPFPITIADAMDVLADVSYLRTFDLVHASPPCPRYSAITSTDARGRHPDLIGPVREALRRAGISYVIENVPGAPLDHPVLLCGSAFGLNVRRHRLFESNLFMLSTPCQHDGVAVGVYGAHPDRPGGWLRPDGTSRGVKASSIQAAQDALGVDWMSSWDDLVDAIPPAYTEFVGAQLID